MLVCAMVTMFCLGVTAELCYKYIGDLVDNDACTSSPCEEQLYDPPWERCYDASSPTGYSDCHPDGTNTYEVYATVFAGGTCSLFKCNNANVYLGTATNTNPFLALTSCGHE